MNKPFVKITRDYLGGLREKESNDSSIYILGAFLTSDVSNDGIGWKKWALEDIESIGGGNFSSIEVYDNKVCIKEGWAKEGDPFILLSKEEFIHVLDEWSKAYTKDTKEIIITREEDGSIKFEVKRQ